MSKAAFLVEGELEKKFVEKIYPNHPVQKIGCNGDEVCIEAISKHIATKCRLYNNRYYPIIIIFDREDRTASISELKRDLLTQLSIEGINDTFIVGISNRMVENWILADEEIVKQYTNTKKPFLNTFEGLDGKKEIKKFLPTYHETTDGVELLLKCRASIIKNKSISFTEFFNDLPDNNCYWLLR